MPSKSAADISIHAAWAGDQGKTRWTKVLNYGGFLLLIQKHFWTI